MYTATKLSLIAMLAFLPACATTGDSGPNDNLIHHTPRLDQDETPHFSREYFAIEGCKWFSVLARDVMTARQQGEPMSETLPFALDRIHELPIVMLKAYTEVTGQTDRLENLTEEDTNKLQKMLDDLMSEMKPVATQVVRAAYETPAYSFEANQNKAISDFENTAFGSCYEGFEEREANREDEPGSEL